MDCMHCNVGNTGTINTVDGFWHSSQKVQCYSVEHIAFCSHTGQPEPGAVGFNSFITITFDQIRWSISSQYKNHWGCGTSDSGWNKSSHFKLEEKQLQCLRCKQMCHCILVTLKVGILLKVKQSSDNLNNRSYYWLHSVKSQLLCMHLKLELKTFTVYRSVLFAKRK